MIKIDKKLEKIKKSCLDIAKKELIVLKEENEACANEKITQMVEEYQDVLSIKYRNELNKLKREYNRNLFDYEMKENVSLNKIKSGLFENIKEEVTIALKEFTDSKEYKNYLIKNVEETLKVIEKGILYITEKDFKKYKDELEKKFNIKIDKINDNNIGGCKVVSNKISIDNTIKNSIEEKLSKVKF